MSVHFFGRQCAKHPGAKGKRYRSSGGCVECACAPRENRHKPYLPGTYKRLSSERKKKQKLFAAKWAKENHPRRKIHMATHKLKSFAAGGQSATGEQLVRLWEEQKGRCALTGVPVEFAEAHLDHIRPTSKGGAQTIDNLRWTHPMANAAKGTRTDAEFWHWLEQVIVNYRRGNDGQQR